MMLPHTGWSREQVFQALERFREHDLPWRNGRTWAYVYDPGKEAEEVIKQAYMMYLTENGLDPTAFPSTLRLENELVAMAAAHLNGDAEVVGNFTSGGTESIILAVKAARDYARDRRPEITHPELLLPTTAHAAFHKAAHYLGLTRGQRPGRFGDLQGGSRPPCGAPSRRTPCSWSARPSPTPTASSTRSASSGSSPCEHHLLLHVDACMGGFLLPYFRRLGAPVPDFDFSVPGVTSISMDFHKYAFAAKGASTILYRTKELRKYQMYACANWTGYTVINPTVQSSKSVGPLAAAWAVLHFIGDDGYLEIARQVLDATRRIAAGHRRHPRSPPARTAGDEPGGLHLRHGQRVPRHRRDEGARLVHSAAAQLRQLA